MYVIFPADEVVYLSYGRLIYVPKAQESGQETAASPTSSTIQRVLDNICSNPSVPSTSTSSTRSFHSVVNGPSLSSYSEDLQESSHLHRGALETLQGSVKSNKSWPQPSTSKTKNSSRQPPVRPNRAKKKSQIVDNCEPPAAETKTGTLLQVPIKRSGSKSPSANRKLSYSDYVEVYDSVKSKATIEPLGKTPSSEGDPSIPISPRVKLARTVEQEIESYSTLPNPKTHSRNQQAGQKRGGSIDRDTRTAQPLNRERSPKSLNREKTPVNSPRHKYECEYSLSQTSTWNSKNRESSLNPDSRLQLTNRQQLTPGEGCAALFLFSLIILLIICVPTNL